VKLIDVGITLPDWAERQEDSFFPIGTSTSPLVWTSNPFDASSDTTGGVKGFGTGDRVGCVIGLGTGGGEVKTGLGAVSEAIISRAGSLQGLPPWSEGSCTGCVVLKKADGGLVRGSTREGLDVGRLVLI